MNQRDPLVFELLMAALVVVAAAAIFLP